MKPLRSFAGGDASGPLNLQSDGAIEFGVAGAEHVAERPDAEFRFVEVAGGQFSLFTEVSVKEGEVRGYVKPLFRDLKVYGKDKDEDRTFGQKVKEKAIDVAAKVLKNRPRKEVATVVDISGPIDSPQTKTWPALVRLIQNAFIKAILPGFQREASRAERD